MAVGFCLWQGILFPGGWYLDQLFAFSPNPILPAESSNRKVQSPGLHAAASTVATRDTPLARLPLVPADGRETPPDD